MEDSFTEVIERILDKDSRFAPEAYVFISNAVQYTSSKLMEQEEGRRHISGQELLDGIRDYAIGEFGPMAKTVFESWGVRNTLSIGYIVFNMVDFKLLNSSANDSINDFRNGYSFTEAFETPFLPAENANDTPLPVIA